MTEDIHTLLVELYAEQAKGGASDERLAATMDRIRRNLKPAKRTTVPVDLDATRRFQEQLNRALKGTGARFV